jgi:hypothetical protein
MTEDDDEEDREHTLDRDTNAPFLRTGIKSGKKKIRKVLPRIVYPQVLKDFADLLLSCREKKYKSDESVRARRADIVAALTARQRDIIERRDLVGIEEIITTINTRVSGECERAGTQRRAGWIWYDTEEIVHRCSPPCPQPSNMQWYKKLEMPQRRQLVNVCVTKKRGVEMDRADRLKMINLNKTEVGRLLSLARAGDYKEAAGLLASFW